MQSDWLSAYYIESIFIHSIYTYNIIGLPIYSLYLLLSLRSSKRQILLDDNAITNLIYQFTSKTLSLYINNYENKFIYLLKYDKADEIICIISE